MRILILNVLLVQLVYLSSCAKERERYFVDGGFMLEKSHANVIREFVFFGEDSPGVTEGFDLDGVDNREPDAASCYVEDMVDSEGRAGIDNQLAKIWTDLEPLIGEATQGLLHGAINEGRFLMMVELEGVDDLQNDDDVTVHILRGSHKPDIGTEGKIAPYQTFYADEDFPSSRIENMQIVDGILEAGPLEFSIPVDILDAKFILPVRRGMIRLRISDDGSFSGYIGGFMTPSEFLSEMYETGAKAEAELVTPLFEENTDSAPQDGRCMDMSAAFGFSGATAFVVRKKIPR